MTLTHSPAQILAAYLVDQALGTDPSLQAAWGVYINFMPDHTGVNDNMISVRDTTGLKESRCMNGVVSEFPGIQIKIRSKTFSEGWAKVKAIANALDVVAGASTNIGGTGGTDYTLANLSRTSPAIPLGFDPVDSKRRDLFSINYLATLQEV